MKAIRSALTLAAGCAVLIPAVCSADAWLLQPGEHYCELRASHGSAGEVFDALGARRDLSELVQDRELLSYNEIGWFQRVSLVAALPARSLTLRQLSDGSATATGFGDLRLGARVRILDGSTGLSVQGEWKAPLGYQHTQSPKLGDGQQDFVGMLNLGTGFRALNAFLEVRGGYRYRMEEPGDRIELAADLGFWILESLLLEGRYAGFSSSEADFFPESEAHVAGPRVTYRVDDRLDVFAGSSHVVDGVNVAATNSYYAGVAFKQTRLNRLQGFLGGKRGP
jgi:hypothetical protein